MSDETKKATDEASLALTRRKLVYVAPVIMSQRLFNAVTGCGKVNPSVQACSLVSFQS